MSRSLRSYPETDRRQIAQDRIARAQSDPTARGLGFLAAFDWLIRGSVKGWRQCQRRHR